MFLQKNKVTIICLLSDADDYKAKVCTIFTYFTTQIHVKILNFSTAKIKKKTAKYSLYLNQNNDIIINN